MNKHVSRDVLDPLMSDRDVQVSLMFQGVIYDERVNETEDRRKRMCMLLVVAPYWTLPTNRYKYNVY